ncbi:MAG TPA: hypothetical protein VI547_05960, partial [Anaerolineales bacterium]|nr:hypothetical protein [Anaerolineales bacterium]
MAQRTPTQTGKRKNANGLINWLVTLTVLYGLFAAPQKALAAPGLSVSPGSGPAGSVVTLSGSGYTPGGYNGTVRWDGADQFTFSIPAGGSFNIQFTVPGNASTGNHTFTVCAYCGGGEFEQIASASFSVQPPQQPPTYTPPPPPASNNPPIIHSFNLDSAAIDSGSCTYVRWSSSNATSATLVGDFNITVEPNGSWQLCPPATQLYRLTVTGPGGTATAEVTLFVGAAVTPTFTPSLTPTPRPITATFTPTRTPTATNTPASGACIQVPADANVVGFDTVQPGRRISNTYIPGLGEEAGYLVRWDSSLTAYYPGPDNDTPHSGPLVAESVVARTTMSPARGRWTTVGAFVGLPEAASGTVTVTLRGYDVADTEVGVATVTIGPGITPFDNCLIVSAPLITRVELRASAPNGGLARRLYLDDFFFIGSDFPTCPGSVEFTTPANNADLGNAEQVILGGVFSLDARPVQIRFNTGEEWNSYNGTASSNLRVIPEPTANRSRFELTRAINAGDYDARVSLSSPACANNPVAEARLTYHVHAEIDAQVQAIEVTQGIRGNIPVRDWRADLVFPPETSVVHVANRKTVVRVYPWVFLRNGQLAAISLTARLHGQRDGVELPGSPLSPANGVVYFDPAWTLADMRGNAGRSLNFVLPRSWTQAGNLSLTVEIAPTAMPGVSECTSCATNNTSYLSGVRFQQVQTKRIRMRIYLADYYWSNGSEVRHAMPTLGEVLEAYQYWKSTWPVADNAVRLEFRYTRIARGTCEGTGTARICISEAPGIPVWDNAVYLLESAEMVPPRYVTDPYAYLPLVFSPASPINCEGRAGVGWPPQFHAGACGATFAQEAAHSIGLNHASNAHGELAGGLVDPAYPGPHGEIESNAYGFDTTAMQAFAPSEGGHMHDFMSYGRPAWVSIYTWQKLARAFGATDIRVQSPAPHTARLNTFVDWEPQLQSQEIDKGLVFSGQIDPDGVVTLYNAVFRGQLPVPDASETVADYRIELRDSNGQPLASEPFAPRPLTHAATGTFSFFIIVPDTPGVRQVAFLNGNTLLVSFPVSAAPPEVELLEPAAGATWPSSGEITLRWQTLDSDSPTLFHQIEITKDDGQTWTVLGSGIQGTEFKLDLATVPASGDHWQLRIQASDGYNTAIDQVGPITIEPKGPMPIILEPLDGATLRPGQSLTVVGQANDWTEGDVPAESLEWLLDGQLLGVGEEISVENLSEGKHTLTLRAANNRGLTGEHSISITVANDADADGLPDEWETGFALNPNDSGDAQLDSEMDGLQNWQEFGYGTNPLLKDSDGDGFDDATEIASGSDPTDADSRPRVNSPVGAAAPTSTPAPTP